MRSMRRLLQLLSFVLAAAPALASDGVLEINHVCAVSSGCFPGDTAGYPVTITAPGSYRLTSNLVVSSVSLDGILISTSDVSIDLAGFEIARVSCPGVSTDCTPISGTGSGVKCSATSNRAVSVRNGTITGMGANGVDLGEQAEVRDLRVRWNRIIGVKVSNGSNISGVTAYQNGSSGIDANPGSTIVGNTAYDNGLDGIHSFSGSTVRSNTVYGNDDDGIDVSAAANISDNTIYQNSDYGISTGAGATISGNTVFDNFGGGISAGSGSLIQGNAIRHNSTWGMVLFSTAGYRENVITTQFSAGTVSGGVDLGGNLCDGGTTCP